MFLHQFVGLQMTFRSSHLHRSISGVSRQSKEETARSEWVFNSVYFYSFFIRGKDSESDRTEKLFSPTGVMQFLFKLRYLRCHAAVPINMP